MKTIPIIVALFAFLCCARGAESSGWEGMITHKDSEKELRTTPKITVQKVVQDTNLATVLLLVENRTGIDIDYDGYSKKGPQIFIKGKRDGKWVATSWDWCGTGMEKHVLRNQKTITLEIRVTKSPIQVFTIFRNAKDPQEFSIVKLYEKDSG